MLLTIVGVAVYVTGRGPELKEPTVLCLVKDSLEQGIVAMPTSELAGAQCREVGSPLLRWALLLIGGLYSW